MTRALVSLVVGLAASMQVSTSAGATALVADLSKHLVAITTGFAGSDVLLYGAVDGPGDVVIVVRGPQEPIVMHRKSRIIGVWANTATMTFKEAPSFYAVASSRALGEVASAVTLDQQRIGLEHLNLDLGLRASPNLAKEWEQALIRNMQRRGLYADTVRPVTFLGSQLFRSEVSFPANVPTGQYQVEVYLLREGRIVQAQTIPLIVSKIGLEAEIFDFAYNESALYGLIAILVALVSGWLAHIAFRKA